MDPRSDSHLPGATAIVFVMTALLLLPWLGETLFNSKGEPREAIVAVSMLQQGDWVLPHNFATDIPYKPPFLAWLIAAFACIFNGGVVNEYISRLPSALAALAMVMGCYSWGRNVRGTRFGMVLAFVVLGCIEVFRAALACRVDMVLTACMTGAMIMLYDLCERRVRFRALRYLGVFALLVCATLTKGPVGALLPCFAVGIYRLLRRRPFWSTFFMMLGLALGAIAVTGLWYYAAYLRGGEQFFSLMMEENIGRLTGNMSYESHVKPFWYNFVTLILGLLPWTLLLVLCLFGARRFRIAPLKPAALFSLTMAVVIIGFFCIPESKRSVYLLPAYPFICYGIANVLTAAEVRRYVRIFTWIMAVIAVIAPVAVIALQIWPQPKLLQVDTIIWWRYIALALPLAAGMTWFVNRHSPVGHCLAIVWSIYVAYAVAAMPAVLNPKSDIKVVDTLKTAPAVLCAEKYRPYTLNFYLDNTVTPVSGFDETDNYPSGTVILLPADAENLDIPANFRLETLLQRSCDTRSTMFMAIKE